MNNRDTLLRDINSQIDSKGYADLDSSSIMTAFGGQSASGQSPTNQPLDEQQLRQFCQEHGFSWTNNQGGGMMNSIRFQRDQSRQQTQGQTGQQQYAGQGQGGQQQK